MNKKTLAVIKSIDHFIGLFIRLIPKKQQKNQSTIPSSILVIKLSAMGDALCLMPSVRMLDNAFPGARIEWLTTHKTQPYLFREFSFIDRIIVLSANPFITMFHLISNFLEFRRYDLIIDYDQYYRLSELIANFGKLNAGFRTPIKNGGSICEDYDPLTNEKIQFKILTEKVISFFLNKEIRYFTQLPELISSFKPGERFANDLYELESFDKPLMVVYPGSSANASFRRWGVENYIEIIGILCNSCEIIVAGGPDEVELSAIFNREQLPIRNWIGRLNLFEWAFLFSNHADLFLGNDGGLLHLADAMGLPSVSIFGPALYSKWGSLNPDSYGIEVDLDCRPCLKNYLGQVPQYCARGDMACLLSINKSAVLSVVREKLFLKNIVTTGSKSCSIDR